MVKSFAKIMCASVALVGVWVQADVTINGAGATFPAPIYTKFVAEYNRIKPEVKINYAAEGSGAGISKLSDGTVDYAGTDSPMKDAQIKKAQGGNIYHIPTVMGAVVAVYNIEGVDKPLNFTGPVLADIFLGNISNWNDARIAAINEGVKLPDQAITVVHRADKSGTTAIFTDYLAKVSPAWNKGPGKGSDVKWPAASSVGGNKNDGVAATVQQVKGAIGYVELIYALENKMPFAAMQNKSGKFVMASMESVSAAAGNLKDIPADLRISITDAEGDDSYPISGLTWIIVYENQKDAAKGAALVEYLWWVTHDGQALAPTLHYATLPKAIMPKVETLLKSIKADGQPIMK